MFDKEVIPVLFVEHFPLALTGEEDDAQAVPFNEPFNEVVERVGSGCRLLPDHWIGPPPRV